MTTERCTATDTRSGVRCIYGAGHLIAYHLGYDEREEQYQWPVARVPFPGHSVARPPSSGASVLSRPRVLEDGRRVYENVPPCHCDDRRGPAGGVCGNCCGAIP